MSPLRSDSPLPYFLLLEAAPFDDDMILPPSSPPAAEASRRARPFFEGMKRSYRSRPATHNQRNWTRPVMSPIMICLALAFPDAKTPPNKAPANTITTSNIPDIPSSNTPASINADTGSRSTRPKANPARLPKRTETA